jgi:hypothetical protein
MSGAVSSERLGEALHAVVTQGVPLARALVGLGFIDEARLEEELARSQPLVLRKVVPMTELMAALPPGLCHRLAAAPVRLDERSGAVDVAVLDARDPHPAAEISYHLDKPARTVRATYSALREALEGYPHGARSLAAPMGSPRAAGRGVATPIWGTPAVAVAAPSSPPTTRAWDDAARREAAPASKLPPSLPNSAIPLMRKTSVKPAPEPGASAMSPISRVPEVEAVEKLDDADVKFATRSWENIPASEPGWAEEVYWEIEPVFELRRLGPPPTIREPGPPTIRLSAGEEAASSMRLPAPARLPLSVNAPSPPYPDVGTTLAALRAAADRDEVLALVQTGVRAVARRVALLVVKKDGMAGWSCTPEFGDEVALKQLKIPIRAPNLLTAVLSGSVHLGPLMGTFAAPLLRVMRKPSRDVAMAAVRVGDRPAVLIVADELGDTMLATKRIDELARAAGDALLRVLRSRRG